MAESRTAAVRSRSGIEAPKLATMVARHLEDEVVARGWPVGDVVGSERELLERFGVSRAVLREAIRIVEHTGAARMRRGPGGGLVVSEPNRDAVVSAMGVWFSYVGVTLTDIVEARRPLLAAACRLAAQRIDRDGAAELRVAAQQELSRGAPLADRLNAVEALIARSARNPALALLIASIAEVGIGRLKSGRAVLEPALAPSDVDEHLAGYRRLIEAVEARDGAHAASIAEELADFVLSRVRDRPISRRATVDGVRSNGKLAEGVARALRDDIERSGWPVGFVLGSETELGARYGVSRAILREAVRILEHHGAVRTKRGPHGGLIVTAPDSAALARAARIVLEYEGVTGPQLVEAREVVEVAAAGRAAARATPDAAAALAATLEAEERGGDAARTFITLHDQIAATTRNGVIALFVDVLDSLVPAHVKPEQRSGVGMRTLSVEVHRAHRRIVEAIVAGEPELAERRMLRHLRASGAALE